MATARSVSNVRRLPAGGLVTGVALMLLPVSGALGAAMVLSNAVFLVAAGDEGITDLRRQNDAFDTSYIAAGRALGADVTVRYREAAGGDWRNLAGDAAVERVDDRTLQWVRSMPDGLRLEQRFTLAADHLDWSLTLSNLSGAAVEVGDLAVPMVFAEGVPRDRKDIYSRKLIRHAYVAGNGSWIYWSRANAVGPYLVMTAGSATSLEYFDNSTRAFTPYIHGSVASREPIEKALAFGGKAPPWRLPLTTAKLAASGAEGSSATYRFRFRFAPDVDGVRDVLYEENLFDVTVLPGMTVPVDLSALVSLRTKVKIQRLEAEFPEATRVEDLGLRESGNQVYRVAFSRLGENKLTVRYGDGEWMSLQFFVTESLETLISKRAHFLTTRQQHSDPTKPWYGAYGDWDQIHKVLRSPEDRDGLSPWLVDSSDDAGNARPAFVAAKNVFLPVSAEVESVERYIRYYLWNDLKDGKGGMQMSETELYPYGIYGTFDNWWGHRVSSDPGRNGRAHLWRIYDYPHIIHLYYRMYQLATYYPNLVKWRTAPEYLELAYRTAKAYWEVPLKVEGWSADSVGTMNEAFLPELIQSLEDEGKKDWAEEIRRHWRGKVAEFVLRPPNLYGSEFAFDSTGFESSQAFARYAMLESQRRERAGVKVAEGAGFDAITPEAAAKFAKLQMALNVCDRGWLETTYFQLGTDYRGSMSYLLSYMSQLGGWGVLDQALYFEKDPSALLRLGYASSLSSWALVNSGTAESGYGYWYAGEENDGACGGGFVPEAWGRGWIRKAMPRGAWYYSAEQDVGFVGALRTHCTILSDDPLFGEVVLGGTLRRDAELASIIPRDGLGARSGGIRPGESRRSETFQPVVRCRTARGILHGFSGRRQCWGDRGR